MLHVIHAPDQACLVAKKPRLSPTQVGRLRDLANRLLNEQFGGNRSKFAPVLGVSQPSLSRFLSENQGIAEPLALKLCEMADVSPDDYGLATAPISRLRPTLGALPSWGEAEATARRLYPHLPDGIWLSARKFSAPDIVAVTPDMILHLAMAAEAAARKAS